MQSVWIIFGIPLETTFDCEKCGVVWRAFAANIFMIFLENENAFSTVISCVVSIKSIFREKLPAPTRMPWNEIGWKGANEWDIEMVARININIFLHADKYYTAT